MPLEFPIFQQIVDRTRADIAAILPDLDPTLENSLIDAIVTSTSSRISDLYLDLSRLLNETFPQNASGEFLDFFGEIFGVPRLPAAAASGSAVFGGTSSTVIPLATEFSGADGVLFTSTVAVSISALQLAVTSLTRSGTTATAVFASAHGLASGISAAISGAVETDYNGTFVITVTAPDTIEYTVAGSPTTPATGTILMDTDVAIVPMDANLTGVDGNRDSGAQMNLSSTIVGVTSPGFVDFTGMIGGADTETDDSYRVRIILERSSLEALFNVAQITQQALSVSGVTRVFVKEVTPFVGAVTIFFMRDDDATTIPSAAEVAEVKSKILEIKPAHTEDADVVVSAPTPVNADFTFTALVPDTPTMEAAIRSNLEAFFRDQVQFETDVLQDQYNSVIFTTIDPSTGDTVSSFTLSSPAGDITVTTGEIAVLNSVTF